MSVIIYREGGSHVVDGIKCDQIMVEASRLHAHLANGCVVDPKELNAAPSKSEADTNNTGRLSNKEIRAAAEKANIEGFDTKRITALKTELGYDS